MAAKRAKRRRPKVSPVVVRPKSSRRKFRSNVVLHTARLPLQERSRARFDEIIRATGELLQVANIADISFYDIARQAKIPPASVSYFFPTMAALHKELSERYNASCSQTVMNAGEDLARTRNPRWQEWIGVILKRSSEYLNANRPVCEVLLGPLLHLESKRQNCLTNDRVGASMLESFREVFIVTDSRRLESMFVVIAEIADVLWSRSYALEGRIEEHALTESVRVAIAYLGTELPETLPLVRDSR